MKKHLLAALAFILSVVFLAGCATDVPLENDYTVRVMLRPCDGITIEGDNIVDITAGRNVSFKVRLDEGYTYLGNTANGEFDAERGRLRLTVGKNIRRIDGGALSGSSISEIIIPNGIGAENISVPNNSSDELFIAGGQIRLAIFVDPELYEEFISDYFWGDYDAYLAKSE